MRANASAKSSRAVRALHRGVGAQRAASRPSQRLQALRRAQPHLGVVAGQAPVVGVQQIAALGLGDRREVVLPRVGEEAARAVLVEPVDLALAQQEDAAQHQLGHALGVRLRVGERERAAPRAAEHLPALDAEVLAQPLDVGDEVPGGVVLERTRAACSCRSRADRRARCGTCAGRRSGAGCGSVPPPGPPCTNSAGLAAAGCRTPRSSSSCGGSTARRPLSKGSVSANRVRNVSSMAAP